MSDEDQVTADSHSTTVLTTGAYGQRVSICTHCAQRARESGQLPDGMIAVVAEGWHEGVCDHAAKE